jgi:hypothetical protein
MVFHILPILLNELEKLCQKSLFQNHWSLIYISNTDPDQDNQAQNNADPVPQHLKCTVLFRANEGSVESEGAFKANRIKKIMVHGRR